MFLGSVYGNSLTTKCWVENLIKLLFICLLFARPKRKGDWMLHLAAVKSLLPYFYAAGYHNYAHYTLFNMEKLPQEVLLKFMKGEHVMRHQQGYWNDIWLGMHLEATFMCYGKGPGHIGGATLKPAVVKKWATSLRIRTEILKDLDETWYRETSKHLEFHKKEGKGQIKGDKDDRAVLRDTLKKRINPLDTDVNGLVNMHTGIKVQNSNVYESVKLGEQQRQQFEDSWPDVMKKSVRTMKSGKQCSKSGKIEVLNTELIYSRVMC